MRLDRSGWEAIVAGADPEVSFNDRIIEEIRENEGHVGGPLADTAMILVHHIGARSGIERIVPLVCRLLEGQPFRDRRLPRRIALASSLPDLLEFPDQKQATDPGVRADPQGLTV
jgi:hypothetical protein